ncbi:hypothetical protein ACFP1H_04595 [Secundilactobacillus hailunensis]|uniref:NEAT domain-containing protein n=1 Tax=Secundilactobacillus hailunensis TaxID=2559923 RepID=A0ABW1T8B1_9LACO|nr:hypothetical protein [Secundilactobacillus hailunensis]
MSYTVLQADDKSISMANRFYTHEADVEELSDGSCQVTMHVQYDKNSGMSAKGFVPLTVDGQKVSNVNYGSTNKSYTASFSFTVPTDALTQAPVKGTIHVSVPTMGMNSDFDVYYNFTNASTAGGTDITDATTSGTDNSSASSGSTPTTNDNKGVSQISYKVLQANDKSTSAANQFYTRKADVKKLSDGSYQVTMHVQYGKNSGMSAKGFVPLTVNGRKVSNVTYGSTDKMYTASFSFTAPTRDALTKAPVKGTIHVSVPTMKISSDFDVYYQFTSAGGTDKTNKDDADDSSTPSTDSSSAPSDSTPTTNDKVSKMSYKVLQANDKSISEANRFYTHKADVKKLANGSYQVTMHVQYGKNSGMSAKGFVPLTVMGHKVSNVTYGSTDKMYTASFSFTVPTLADLTKAPIKGTIHVSVPMAGISSDFDIYYQFTGAPAAGGGTDTTNAAKTDAAGANAVPGKGSNPKAKAHVVERSSGRLPQTSDVQNGMVAVVGIISVVLVTLTAIIRKKSVQ